MVLALIYRVGGLLGCSCLYCYWRIGAMAVISIIRLSTSGAYQFAGFILAALVIWLGVRREWPDTVNTGADILCLFLYSKLFRLVVGEHAQVPVFLMLGLCAVLILLVLRRLRSRHGLLGGAQ